LQQPVSHAGKAPLAIIVMGVSGSGKSTLGALLSRMLGCSFFEGDAFHDAASVAKMSVGQPLSDDDRWPWLDRLGVAIGDGVASRGLAVGACSALKRSYRDRLGAAIGAPTRFVLLDNSREELLRRLNSRPDHYMPASLLDSQLAILERPQAHEPAVALDASVPPDQLCEAALAWLETTLARSGAAAPASGHQSLPPLG
jgi:gluconokinase